MNITAVAGDAYLTPCGQSEDQIARWDPKMTTSWVTPDFTSLAFPLGLLDSSACMDCQVEEGENPLVPLGQAASVARHTRSPFMSSCQACGVLHSALCLTQAVKFQNQCEFDLGVCFHQLDKPLNIVLKNRF